jgi:hypothetical protein
MLLPLSGQKSVNVILIWSEGGWDTGTLSEPIRHYRNAYLVSPNDAKKQR